MKIFAIVGSHKKNGATASAVKKEIDAVFQEGDEVKIIYPSAMNIHYCTGCDYCRKVEGCSQKDDMASVIQDIYDADLVIIGSPIYFGEISGQLKTLIDRLHPGYRKRGDSRFKGKKLIRVFTQGSPCERYGAYRDCNAENAFGLMEFDMVKTVVVGVDGENVE